MWHEVPAPHARRTTDRRLAPEALGQRRKSPGQGKGKRSGQGDKPKGNDDKLRKELLDLKARFAQLEKEKDKDEHKQSSTKPPATGPSGGGEGSGNDGGQCQDNGNNIDKEIKQATIALQDVSRYHDNEKDPAIQTMHWKPLLAAKRLALQNLEAKRDAAKPFYSKAQRAESRLRAAQEKLDSHKQQMQLHQQHIDEMLQQSKELEAAEAELIKARDAAKAEFSQLRPDEDPQPDLRSVGVHIKSRLDPAKTDEFSKMWDALTSFFMANLPPAKENKEPGKGTGGVEQPVSADMDLDSKGANNEAFQVATKQYEEDLKQWEVDHPAPTPQQGQSADEVQALWVSWRARLGTQPQPPNEHDLKRRKTGTTEQQG